MDRTIGAGSAAGIQSLGRLFKRFSRQIANQLRTHVNTKESAIGDIGRNLGTLARQVVAGIRMHSSGPDQDVNDCICAADPDLRIMELEISDVRLDVLLDAADLRV